MSKINYSPDTTLTLESLTTPGPDYCKSLFTSHALQVTTFKPSENQKSQPDWIFGILLLGFILLTWSSFFYFNRLKQIFLAPLSKRFLNQLIRDGNLFKERISIALAMIYVLGFSLLFYLANQVILKIPLANIRSVFVYLMIMGSLVTFWLIKTGLIRLLGIIFKTSSTTRDYLLNMLIFNIVTGILLLPALVCTTYLKSNILLYITIIIWAILVIFRFLKGFYIGLSLTKFSYLFLFVYLCTLEIMPLMILIKFLVMTS